MIRKFRILGTGDEIQNCLCLPHWLSFSLYIPDRCVRNAPLFYPVDRSVRLATESYMFEQREREKNVDMQQYLVYKTCVSKWEENKLAFALRNSTHLKKNIFLCNLRYVRTYLQNFTGQMTYKRTFYIPKVEYNVFLKKWAICVVFCVEGILCSISTNKQKCVDFGRRRLMTKIWNWK